MTRINTGKTMFVFVGGVHRSGTSLLQKILGLHSEVYGGPELGILKGLMQNYQALSESIVSEKLSMVLGLDSARLAYQEFLKSVFKERMLTGDYRIISEKTPANLDVFPQLAEVFPDAKFLWVIRDPRDVVCSLQAVQKRGKKKGVRIEVGRWLHRDLQEMRSSIEIGEAFRRSNSDRLSIVCYEDLTTDSRRVIQEACDFLGIPFEKSMLATEQSDDISRAIESDRPTKGVFYTRDMYDRPIDASRIGVWRTELGGWAMRAVEAELGGGHLPSLDRYGLQRPGRLWILLYRASSLLADLADSVWNRIQRLRLP